MSRQREKRAEEMDKNNDNKKNDQNAENPQNEGMAQENGQETESNETPHEAEDPGKKEKGGKHQKKSALRKPLIIIGIIVGVLAVLVLAAYLVIHSYLSKINYDDGSKPPVSGVPLEPEEEDEGDEPDSPQHEIDAAGQKIDENLKKEQEARRNTKDLTNILLIGSDTRYVGQPGRSDTMMLLTINREDETVSLTSLMRDMYVYVPDYGNTRINNAFARGGAQLLIDTIEANFKIEIDYYAAIDFYSFVDAVDAIGGVTVDVSYDDYYGVNLAIEKYNKTLGLSYSDGKLTEYGEINLTGKQALGYARNRHFPRGDFDRTEHQRVLVSAIFEKAKQADLVQLDALLNAILPGITTDMPETQILSWMVLAPTILQYDFETYRIPIEGSYQGVTIGGASMLSLDFDANIAELHRIVYGEDSEDGSLADAG